MSKENKIKKDNIYIEHLIENALNRKPIFINQIIPKQKKSK